MGVAGHQKRESNEALSNNEYVQAEEVVTTAEEQFSPNHYKTPNSQARMGPPANFESMPVAAAFKT